MRNITGMDRFLRLLLAVLLLEAAFFWPAGTPTVVAYALAVVMGVTGAWGFFPLYRLLGIGGEVIAVQMPDSFGTLSATN